MKIVLVGPFPPFRGGISDLNAALADHLSKRHEIHAINFTTQYPKVLFPGKTQFKKGDSAQEVDSIRCLSSINPFSWRKTAYKIIDIEPDLVLFRFWLPFFAPAFSGVAKKIRKYSDATIMVICDNIIPHEERLLDTRLTKRFFGFIDSFIVLSKKVENELLSFVPEAKYKYSPHPIYSIFNNTLSKEQAKAELKLATKKVLLFFGLIREYKGLDILINAMEKIKTELEDYTLLIVGECYENENKYTELIKKAGITDNVKCHYSFIPDNEVGKYFSAADVVVLPYKTASQSGIVQIAYHFDTPVIVSNVGGLPEIVDEGKTGYCVEPNSNAFAKAIKAFYENDNISEMNSNISEYKSQFSWDAMVKAIEKLVNVH
ncbi:MAG TPA: glycosyltransferase [Candidatus Marinimicrobia bacterium]|nr:glycosyltransferase [Candidatus Neomarinimicrobiota bacterium]